MKTFKATKENIYGTVTVEVEQDGSPVVMGNETDTEVFGTVMIEQDDFKHEYSFQAILNVVVKDKEKEADLNVYRSTNDMSFDKELDKIISDLMTEVETNA